MSPFTQLNASIGYGSGIDRNFSPLLSYLDEFDRHFSHRHRFMNCFIPRFDLEEDAVNYYLFGDLPGAKVEDLTISAHDNHSLQIYGATKRDIAGPLEPEKTDDEFVKVDGSGMGNENTPPLPTRQDMNVYGERGELITDTPSDQAAAHHSRHITSNIQHDDYAAESTRPSQNHSSSETRMVSNHRVLLSERLVGEFHRTFAFPMEINEEGVRASMEDGVLKVVVPKKAVGEEKKGRRVPILKGGIRKWKKEEAEEGGQ